MWHLCLPLCHIPWGLILPVAPLLAEPCLSSSSPSAEGSSVGRTLAEADVFIYQRQKRCSGADGNAPGHTALSDTAVTLH